VLLYPSLAAKDRLGIGTLSCQNVNYPKNSLYNNGTVPSQASVFDRALTAACNGAAVSATGTSATNPIIVQGPMLQGHLIEGEGYIRLTSLC
jgi:hypothetical protein